MVFWTIQSKDVLDILLKDNEYYPNFELCNKYGDMRKVYPLLLEAYNSRNEKNLNGLLFGFGEVNNSEIKEVKDIYDYLINNPDISVAFDFWSKDYCVLKVDISEKVDLIPIDFNDFIKLTIGKTNDVSRASMLEQITPNYSFNTDVYNILSNFNKGVTKPVHPSFIQIHYSHLSIDNILDVYSMIDYKSGEVYNLNNSAIELKNVLNKSKEII